MDRRTFLGSAALIALGEHGETTVETTALEARKAASPALEIVTHEGIINEREFLTDVYVTAIIENTGDAPSGLVELNVEWYDSNGDYRNNDSVYLQSLAAGERWAAQVPYIGRHAESLQAYDIGGEYDTEPPSFDPDGLDLIEHEMQRGEDSARITGRVANNTGDTADYVQAIGTVYDSDGLVLGDALTNVTNVPAGETWAFEITWYGYGRTSEARDHAVSITDSVM